MTTEQIVDPGSCRRLQGGSIRNCVCRLPNGGGWLPCPPDAQGVLTPVPDEPPPLTSGLAVPIQAVEKAHEPARHEKVLVAAGGAVLVHAPPPAGGYAGEMCGECNSFNTRRTGTCIQCLDCYATGGCG